MKNILFLLFFVILFISCNTKNDNIVIVPPITSYTFDKSSFPLKVGNWWRYRVQNLYSPYDKLSSFDTLTFKIVSEEIFLEKKIYKCITIGSKFGDIDTTNIELNDSLLSHKSKRRDCYALIPEFVIKIPLSAYDKWSMNTANWKGNHTIRDTNYLVSYNKNFKMLNNFYDIFYLKRIALDTASFNEVQDLQISNKIGLVSQNVRIRGVYIDDWRTFSLIDYHLE